MSKDDTVVLGAKIRLYPSAVQARQFDVWRIECMKLWNLLLGMQQAAYSGDKFRPDLGWRKIWADVAKLNHEAAVARQEEKKANGEKFTPVKEPDYMKILPSPGAGKEAPKLFIWENDLQKLMARLKKIPQTKWIAGIHSHAAQHVCKDMILALQNMLNPKMNSGFPRFKKASTYADGTVYFANIQIAIGENRKDIRFPLGVGAIKCGEFGNIPHNASLREARISRTGEEWWMGAIFKFQAPEPLPKTGRECGVKIAAKNVYTAYDGEGFRCVQTRETRKGIRRRERLAERRRSRREKRSKNWYESCGEIAQYRAGERNKRQDTLHKGSRSIVNSFDKISIDKMDVKEMMAGDVKALRKVNRTAAMAHAAHFVKYKAALAGRTLNETHVLFPSTQICSGCSAINLQMKDGRRLLICASCGNRMQRQKNAAANEFEQGRRVAEATLVLNRA